MAKLYTLGIEPYPGKIPEDPPGPIEANAPFEVRTPAVPSPDSWVQVLVGKRMLEQDSMRLHFKTESRGYVERAAVLKRWLLNGDQSLRTQAEADVVLDALQRMPTDPVDPVETADVKRFRDAALALARARVMQRRSVLD